jgi:hypothetical protein
MTSLSATLARISRRLEHRLDDLERRIDAGDESAWAELLPTLEAAARLDACLTPGAHGELISTKELAARLGVTPKTILKRKGKGQLTPALQRGRLIRWKASAG